MADPRTILAGLAPTLVAKLDDDAFWASREAEYAEERARRDREALDEWRAERAETLIAGGCPRRHVAIALSDAFEQTEATRQITHWPGYGIRALSGGVGFGKTIAAVWWLAHNGKSMPAFVRAAELEAVGRYDKAMRAKWREATSLVLDDLGAEYVDGKGNLMAVLDELIDLYAADGRPLILTTNLVAEAFKGRYGERIASRLRAGQGWCKVTGRDRRGDTP